MKTGCYFDPVVNFQGFDVFVVPEREHPVGYWYAADGRWYMARGRKLLTTVGGTFDNPTAYTEQIVGSCEWRDGHFLYDFMGDRGAVPLTLIAEGLDGSGAYFDPRYRGSGFSVLRFADERMVADWFTCDPSGNQIWFSCVGRPESLRIRQLVGASFRYPSGELLPAGEATLIDNVFTYTLDAVGFRREGEQRLERLI